jgi:uncharacterized membrane protein
MEGMQRETTLSAQTGPLSEQGIPQHRDPVEIHTEREQGKTFGQRSADWTSGFAGSWLFIFIYIGMTLGWCGFNVLAIVRHWDPYPFIFYTFGVSVLAILMSSLILLAGNRQAEIDRAHAENSYHHVDEVNSKQDQQLQILHHQLELMERQISLAMEQHGQILSQLKTLLEVSRNPRTASDEMAPA